jgi:hypothetical protein
MFKKIIVLAFDLILVYNITVNLEESGVPFIR